MSAVSFLTSPLGLGGQTEFELDPLDDHGILFALRGTTTAGTRLFVIDPRAFFTDYAPRVPADVLRSLGLAADDDASLVTLAVVHPGDENSAATANLLAPILLNPLSGRAEQIVLDDDRWPLRADLPAA